MNYNNFNNGHNNENNTNVETFDLDRFITEQNDNNPVNNVPVVENFNDVETIIIKRKTNGKGIWLGILVLICLFGVIGWFVGSYFASNDEKNVNNNDSNNSKLDDKFEESKLPKNEKYTFYKEKTINLHNEVDEFNIVVFYYVDKEKMFNDYDEVKRELEYNLLRRDVYVNNKKIGDTELIDVYEDSNETENYILNDDLSKIKTFKDINNKEEYLVFALGDNKYMIDNGVVSGLPSYRSFAYIINKKGKVLKTIPVNHPGYGLHGIEVTKDKIGDRYYIESVNDDNLELGNTIYLIYPDDNVLDIRDNFIYYIDGGCTGYKEYKLVINNGVLKEDKITEYPEDVILGAGAC